jgi:thioredoxin-related protein
MHNLKFLIVVFALSLMVVSCKNEGADAGASKATTETKIPTKPLKSGASIPATQKNTGSTEGGLQWTSIDDLEAVAKKGDKKVMIDMYTSWCGWCKVMDKKTFTDPEVVKYLNDNFHIVKFNAEQKQPVSFKGKKYEWVNAGRRGVNMLAHEMLNGRLGYPSLVYLDENLNKIKVAPGYKTPEQLLADLKGLEAI